MTNWNKYLKPLGLTDAEISIYLAALKIGAETVQNIAKEVKLSRVTVYAAIENLTQNGLMSSVDKGKKTYYAAEPPERIVALAENKTSQMQHMIAEIKDNLQELKLTQSGDKPVVKLFEGLNAFTAIQEDVTNTKTLDYLCEFGNLDEINRVYPYDKGVRDAFYEKLAKMEMMRRLIFLTTNPKPRTIEANKQIKYLDLAKFNFFGDIFFYNDTVWFSSFKSKQMAVMIKSKEITDTIKAAFEILWENTK